MLVFALSICLLLWGQRAHAESPLEFEVAGLLDAVLVTGDANENVDDLQLGGSGEVIWNNIVLGLRGTRTFRHDDPCAEARAYFSTGPCFPVNARTIGVDGGYEWDLKPLHFSPRLGVGYIDGTGGDHGAGYLEPGFVLSAQFSIIVVGMDVRYRASLGFDRYSGLVEYVRLGVRL